MASKRIQRELKDAVEVWKDYRASDGGPAIWMNPNTDDLFNLEVYIHGPPDSLYEGGLFVLTILFPRDYPFSPPRAESFRGIGAHEGEGQISSKMEIYHLNITPNGKIVRKSPYQNEILDVPEPPEGKRFRGNIYWPQVRTIQYWQCLRWWSPAYCFYHMATDLYDMLSQEPDLTLDEVPYYYGGPNGRLTEYQLHRDTYKRKAKEWTETYARLDGSKLNVLRQLLLKGMPKIHSDETVPWNKGRVGVIGRSGAGKSCLVRSLLGLSNEDRPKSTNAVDTFECIKFDASSGDAYLEKKESSKNETEMRVAEIFRLKKETRVAEKEGGERREGESGKEQSHQEKSTVCIRDRKC